jgi:hypothetical protein
MQRPLRSLNRLLSAALLVVGLVSYGSPADAAPKRPNPCLAQTAALLSVHQQIVAHNTRPHIFRVPEQAAAAAQYNAEAASLNAALSAAKSRLQACIAAATALGSAGPGSPPLETTPSADIRARIQRAKDSIPPNWRPATRPDENGYWRVPKDSPARPLFDILRGNKGPKNPRYPFGDYRLQGRWRPRIGDPDQAYPARRILPALSSNQPGPRVTPDHIISLAEIINLPGFTRLTPNNMYMVTRAPINYQWLSQSANDAKSSRSVALMEGVDPRWRYQQKILEDRTRAQLIDIIRKLLASQG